MRGRAAALIAVLAFIVLFGYLTLAQAATEGLDPFTLASLVILALFAVGALGALLRPPPK